MLKCVFLQDETKENVTLSELSFIPTSDDDGKPLTCRAENTLLGVFIETTWKLEVVCKYKLNVFSSLPLAEILL